MYRYHLRLARAIAPSLLAGILLCGCATLGGEASPSALGGHVGKHRSIKDDPLPAAAGPEPKLASPPPAAPPPRPFRPASGAEVPACTTGSQCLETLKAIVASPDRSWIGRPQSPVDYATGTRLFAYRALHGELSCRQLTLALDETAAATRTFRAAVPGVTTAQSARLLALNALVESELRTERARRCRA